MSKYINADDLLSVLKDIHPLDYNGMALKAQVISLPAADVVEVKHGEWQGTVCSMCGASVSNYYDCDFCPKCGAKMQDNPHWINHTEYGVATYVTDKDVECSECGHRQPKLFDMNFCPKCGADMRGETE